MNNQDKAQATIVVGVLLFTTLLIAAFIAAVTAVILSL